MSDRPRESPSVPPSGGPDAGDPQPRVASDRRPESSDGSAARRSQSDAERFAFTPGDREAVYRAIAGRRDVRHFRPDPVPDEVLGRILRAGGHAPSVGFSQPWNFLVVRDFETRRRLHAHVDGERRKGAERFEGERKERYLALKLEGILDAPLNLCVTCDRERFGPAVLGRNTILEADIFSAVTAVQNLWLAARAEGVGLGWVSILRNEFLSDLLGLPGNVVPVAYLCVGYPVDLPDRPLLESRGWLPRVPLEELVFEDRWDHPAGSTLLGELRGPRDDPGDDRSAGSGADPSAQ